MKSATLGAFFALTLGAAVAGAEPADRPEAAAGPPGADDVISAETHRAALLRVAQILEDRYPDPALGKPAADTIRDRVDQGAADEAIRADRLVAEVSEMIDAMLPQRNIELTDTLADVARSDAMPDSERSATGIRSTRMLPGRTLYLEMDGLPGVSPALNALNEALTEPAAVDAIVFDLRDNDGGSGEMVALICSHLLPEGSPLYTFLFRGADSTQERQATATRRHFGPDVPVFVLTSGNTKQSAEAVAYILQDYGRAVVVGEPTPGIGNPVERIKVEERFELTVPFGLLEYGKNGSTFAGTGVIPDIRVPADEALDAALRELGVAE